MASTRVLALVLGLLATSAFADVYMHNPRGSNNRLNEQSANRNNGDRLFDSQNNNRGGYNVGDKTNEAFDGANAPFGVYPPETVYNVNDQTKMHYPLMYYEGSVLSVEWTAQHGCGGNDANDPHMLNCNMVLQYTCETQGESDLAMQVILRDGGNTNTPQQPSSHSQIPAENEARGHHESEAYYYECKTRNRNRGLFHADQNLNGNSAIYTRQNNNGNRRGLECTEERDYYPYWSPTIWRDIAYLTSDPSICSYITANSQNTVDKCKCTNVDGVNPTDEQLRQITKAGCEAVEGGTWKCWKHNIPAPACEQAPWSRVNHLGNSRHGQPVTYNWTLPTFAGHFDGKKVKTYGPGNDYAKCVFRLRYNISTDDYNAWNISSEFDENRNTGVVSPITNNPTVDVGADLQGLRLAINTAQFGRTFQDRSHVFFIRKRPAEWASKAIHNLNVRGKRGNIVQTYPSVEYDFAPNRLHIKTDDLLHIQWTGSNTHNNGNPAGDGQAGDAGEGTGGTDRHNFVQMLNAHDNFPLPLDKYSGAGDNNIFVNSVCYNIDATQLPGTWVDCALLLATSGYHRTVGSVDGTFDPLLNNAPASLPGGGVVMAVQPGTYHYACTRNNNFSNRSQKGVLIVEA